MTAIGDTPTQMVVDAEHVGIRTVMPMLAVAGMIGGFVLGRVVAPMIDPSFDSLCLSLVFAVMGLVGLFYVGDRIIKPMWSSGRGLEVDNSHLVLRDWRRKPVKETVLQWNDDLKVQAWYFEVPTRRSRVPKGWYCVSVRLVQDELNLILYTFMKPEEAEAKVAQFSEWFMKLLPKKERELITDTAKAARQERFRRLEGQRWYDGAELKAEDFLAVMALITQHGRLSGPVD